MTSSFLLITAVFVPLIGALILPSLGKVKTSFRDLFALILVLTSLFCSLMILPAVLAGEKVYFAKIFFGGINFILYADLLAIFMAIVSSFIGAVIVFYSSDYISHYENQNEYYLLVLLFLGSMMGLVYSGNLIFLYIFWEITAITSWRLIGFYRGKNDLYRADKAVLITVFGSLVMLLAFIIIFQQYGSFGLLFLRGHKIEGMVMLMILFGILSKSATLPFQSWLPDAGVAPSPVTALLHAAVLVKIGVYVFARLFLMTFTFGAFAHTLVLLIAGASALIAAGAAMIETDIKRIIAFSTVSQIGFIFLGLASGTMIGAAGALLYILMHGLAKGGLFLSAGIIEQNTKTKDISKMGGLIKTMPVTAVAFLCCAFSVMGVPPFGGFFSKYMVIAGALQSRQYYIAGLFIAGAFFTILYLLRLFKMIFLGESKGALAAEKSPAMVFSVALLAFLSLAGGLFIYYPAKLAYLAALPMIGIIR